MNLQFTGQVWRQSNLGKTLEFHYFNNPSATNDFLLQFNSWVAILLLST